jgi:hypothetical protein
MRKAQERSICSNMWSPDASRQVGVHTRQVKGSYLPVVVVGEGKLPEN